MKSNLWTGHDDEMALESEGVSVETLEKLLSADKAALAADGFVDSTDIFGDPWSADQQRESLKRSIANQERHLVTVKGQ